MRKPIITLAAAACLAVTACSPADPADTPPATDVATSTAESPDPAMTGSPTMDESMPETDPSMTESPTDGASTPEMSPSASESEMAESTAEDVDLATQSFSFSGQDAIDKAVEEAGGGFVYSIELDWSSDNNAWVYELDVLDGNSDLDMDINADTGVVLELDRDDTDDVKEAIDLESPMTWEEARDKALQAARGQITSWKLEYDDDYTAYEFDIEDSSGDDTEVEINVDTGEVKIDD